MTQCELLTVTQFRAKFKGLDLEGERWFRLYISCILKGISQSTQSYLAKIIDISDFEEYLNNA